MEVSVQELEKWEQGSYRLIDMRSAESLNYGTIPGAEHIDAERLCVEPPENDGRRLVLVCARGQFSLDAAEALEALGYEAYSLAGGYLAWLRRQMEKQNADELCSRVETSLRKRFRKRSGVISPRLSGSMSWCSRATASRSASPAVRTPC